MCLEHSVALRLSINYDLNLDNLAQRRHYKLKPLNVAETQAPNPKGALLRYVRFAGDEPKWSLRYPQVMEASTSGMFFGMPTDDPNCN